MLENLPTYVSVTFILCTLFTLGCGYYILRQSNFFGKKLPLVLLGIVGWLALKAFLGYQGFYLINPLSKPPRFALVLLPPILIFSWAFFTKKGLAFVDSLPLLPITYMSVVRIPVEFCLYWLFLGKAVPELMTFAGRNFDILAGITAPFVAYFGFQKKQWNKQVLLIWNILGLCLLLFIVFNGLLSAPTFLQQFAFDQPNIALAAFPFVWLPAFIVPMVLFGHFVAIRRLRKSSIE